MSMNAEIKAQWVAALRSGEYRQGEGMLHHVRDDNYCCLGVLCDLASKAGVEVYVSVEFNRTSYDGNAHSLPPSVQEWAWLDSELPEVGLSTAAVLEVGGSEDEPAHLAGLNDNGWSFEQIADQIDMDL